MRQPLQGAALLLAFVGVEPLVAQDRVPIAAGTSAAAEQNRVASLRQSPPGDALFANDGAIGLSTGRFQQEDGSRAIRQGLIGSWALSGGLRAGVGLFTVTADGRKQAEQRRMRHIRDVGTREERVAAVGLNLRF